MVYTNNVPQANQQISNTQAPIQANFAFLQTGIGREHNFNASGTGLDLYHLQASMPNKALSPILPAGTQGQYFVSGGQAYFSDGTLNYPLSPFCVRAAVNFEGSSSATIRSSFNISSVSRVSLGRFIINYTINMPSVNYCVLITCGQKVSDAPVFGCIRGSTIAYGSPGSPVQLGSIEIETFTGQNGLLTDVLIVNVMVFGG